MRIAGSVAAAALVAGMIVAGGAAAPEARAAPATVGATGLSGITGLSGATGLSGVRARWVELADAATGADLWSKSSVQERPMGSVTKVMTAYAVLTTPGLNLERSVTVPKAITAYDKKYDASTAGLVPGERYTILQLLYALMLPSGCDAAYTIAYALGPGISGFLARMNADAKELGMTKTHFTDVSGLPNPTEYSTYSTVRDLITLGRAAMRNGTFAKITATRSYKLTGGGAHRAHTWKNLNPLLGKYPGAVGIKTGDTLAAGQCLLFEARRGSTTLIGAVLDSGPDTGSLAAAGADATTMLNWGFSR
jgi:D-alanyl-D-alanine carboxypeptidase (penicillin-binding protein 5/6)